MARGWPGGLVLAELDFERRVLGDGAGDRERSFVLGWSLLGLQKVLDVAGHLVGKRATGEQTTDATTTNPNRPDRNDRHLSPMRMHVCGHGCGSDVQ